MAARSTWKGFLKISLVSVPVKAYTTTSSSSGVRLNQLHAECKNRIQYKKTCPVHGEVSNDQIVMGYESAKDQYVVIDPEEVDKLRTEDDKAIKVDVFAKDDAVDPIYLSGKSYYLVPEGTVGQRAYQVVYQGMVESKRVAVAQVVMHGKEQLVIVRPLEGLLVMQVLDYPALVTTPAAFEDEAPKGTVNPAELDMAKALINAQSTDNLDLLKYKDVYVEKLTQLIEARVAGQELVTPAPAEQAQVINLMDALKKSMAQLAPAAAAPAAEPEKKPAAKMSPSKEPKAPAKKKKSS